MASVSSPRKLIIIDNCNASRYITSSVIAVIHRTPVRCVILIPQLMPYRSGEIGASCHAQRENCFIGIALR